MSFCSLCDIDVLQRLCDMIVRIRRHMLFCSRLPSRTKMMHRYKGMSTDPAVLLKRSDGPYYRVHIGRDYEAIAEILSTQQAFAVSPILICPCPAVDAVKSVDEAIQTLCTALQNNWFQAPSTGIASSILLQAMTSTLDTARLDVDMQKEIQSESVNGIVAKDMPEEGTNGIESSSTEDAEGSSTANVDETLWDHVAPCTTKDASKAADIRTTLVQRMGKTESKRILSYCTTTVAKDSNGQKKRVLKAHGQLLKLKQS